LCEKQKLAKDTHTQKKKLYLSDINITANIQLASNQFIFKEKFGSLIA